jgi:hypothetical protein
MKRCFASAYRDAGLARRLLAGARRRARARSVSLYALLIVVSAVAALVAVAALLGFLGAGETP